MYEGTEKYVKNIVWETSREDTQGKWKDNSKMDLQKMRFEDVIWTEMVQVRGQQWDFSTG